MYSRDTPHELRLRPAEESEIGTFEYHPADLENGESLYDPFSYDVACFGGMLCEVIGVHNFSPFCDIVLISYIP